MKNQHNEDPLVRFHERIDTTGDCWIWRGTKRGTMGYGWFTIAGKRVAAHRFSYSAFNGPLEPGKVIMHTCDVPACVNPAHLIQGTHKDNMQDCIAKGRFNGGIKIQTHCKQGHPLEGNNIIQDKYARKCRECHNARRREYRKKK